MRDGGSIVDGPPMGPLDLILQVCGRPEHTVAFCVYMHGPAVNSAGLAYAGSAAAVTDWAAAAGGVAAASPAAAGGGGEPSRSLSAYWANHIPRGAHATYTQVCGRQCKDAPGPGRDLSPPIK